MPNIVGLGFKDEGKVFSFGPLERLDYFGIKAIIKILEGDKYQYNTSSRGIIPEITTSHGDTVVSCTLAPKMLHKNKEYRFREMTPEEIEMSSLIREIYISAGAYVAIDDNGNLIGRNS